jgi:hypothetical protein
MHRNYMKRESTTPGSARASRARFGALAETRLISCSANQSKSSPWRGRHGQHARRVRSPESPWSVVRGPWSAVGETK